MTFGEPLGLTRGDELFRCEVGEGLQHPEAHCTGRVLGDDQRLVDESTDQSIHLSLGEPIAIRRVDRIDADVLDCVQRRASNAARANPSSSAGHVAWRGHRCD